VGVSPAPAIILSRLVINTVQEKRTVARSRRQGKNKDHAEQEVLMDRKHEARDV
jgi:hypothetical protein